MTRLNYLLGLLFILGSLTSSAQLNVQIKAGDRQICVDETITFNDSIVSGTPTSYEWISTVASFSSASSNSTAATFSGSGDVILKTVDGSSTFYDTVFVKVNLLQRTVLRDRTFCQNFGCIDLSETVVISPANINIGTPSWRCLDSNSAVNQFSTNMLESRGSSFAPDWWLCFDEDNYTIQNSDKDTIVLEFTYENEYGCTTKDTVNIEIWRVPKITFSTNRELCWDEGEISLNTLTGVNLTDGAWSIYDSTGFRHFVTLGGLSGDTINTLNSVPLASTNANPKSYLIRYDHIATGCPAQNDTTLTIYPLPVVNLTQLSPDRYCETVADISLNANPAGGTWSSNDPSAVVGGNNFSPGNASIFYPDDVSTVYDYTSPITGCSATDSMSIFIDVRPTISATKDTSFCYVSTGIPRTMTIPVSASNSDQLIWIDFSSRVTLGTTASGSATFTPNGVQDTFRIILNASGRGACTDVDGEFYVFGYQDSSCFAAVKSLEKEGLIIYPNPSAGTLYLDQDLEVVWCINALGQKLTLEKRRDSSYYIDTKGLFTLLLKDLKSGAYYHKKVVIE